MVIALAASAAIYTARAEFSGGTLQTFSGAGAVSLATPAVATPSLADLVEKVRPAVVSIRVRLAVVADSARDGSEPFEGTARGRFLRGPSTVPQQRLLEAQGSGFLVSADGFIVTNNHVVEGVANVQVMMDDGKVADARVVGRDDATDLALLKIDHHSRLPFVALADSKPRVGEWVLAMGNPFGLRSTATAGIVSAIDRDIGSSPDGDGFIQIDAPINRGNSGGPTFDMRGQVIGINTAIYSPSGGSIGIAFDIPAATVKRVIEQLRNHGRVDRGWLGLMLQPLTRDVAGALGRTEAAGALVAGVQAASPAAKAGVVSGDVIVRVNGRAVKDAPDVTSSIGHAMPGETVRLTIRRNGKVETVQVRLVRKQG